MQLYRTIWLTLNAYSPGVIVIYLKVKNLITSDMNRFNLCISSDDLEGEDRPTGRDN